MNTVGIGRDIVAKNRANACRAHIFDHIADKLNMVRVITAEPAGDQILAIKSESPHFHVMLAGTEIISVERNHPLLARPTGPLHLNVTVSVVFVDNPSVGRSSPRNVKGRGHVVGSAFQADDTSGLRGSCGAIESLRRT